MPASRWFLTAFFIPLSFTLIACDQREVQKEYQFFSFSFDGTLQQNDDPASLPPRPFKPWPSQIRVTDMCVFQDRLFFAVNGRGLAEAAVEAGKCGLRYHYSDPLFSGKTTTILVPRQQSLVCHLYVDYGFSDFGAADESGGDDLFIEIGFENEAAVFTPIGSCVKAANPALEAVIAKQLDPVTVAIEWKEKRDEETLFRYSTFNLADRAEIEKDAAWFLDSFPVKSVEDMNRQSGLYMFLNAVTNEVQKGASSGAKCTIFFSVRDASAGAETHYVYTWEALDSVTTSYFSVNVVRTNDSYVALFPDGRVLRQTEGITLQIDRLPGLPEDFAYTKLVETSDFLCAAWEQIDFYRVGRAGILIYLKGTSKNSKKEKDFFEVP